MTCWIPFLLIIAIFCLALKLDACARTQTHTGMWLYEYHGGMAVQEESWGKYAALWCLFNVLRKLIQMYYCVSNTRPLSLCLLPPEASLWMIHCTSDDLGESCDECLIFKKCRLVGMAWTLSNKSLSMHYRQILLTSRGQESWVSLRWFCVPCYTVT